MDAREAELIYEAGKDAVIEALLAMDARIGTLEQQILVLHKKVVSLSSNSTNSSKPPSTDGPQVTKPKKKKSKRTAGGQKGHKGHKRELLSVEEMDEVFDHYPAACAKCSAPLNPECCEETSDPERYQTFELPQIKPIMNGNGTGAESGQNKPSQRYSEYPPDCLVLHGVSPENLFPCMVPCALRKWQPYAARAKDHPSDRKKTLNLANLHSCRG